MWTCREGRHEGGSRLIEIELELLQRRVVPLAGQQLDSAMAIPGTASTLPPFSHNHYTLPGERERHRRTPFVTT